MTPLIRTSPVHQATPSPADESAKALSFAFAVIRIGTVTAIMLTATAFVCVKFWEQLL